MYAHKDAMVCIPMSAIVFKRRGGEERGEEGRKREDDAR